MILKLTRGMVRVRDRIPFRKRDANDSLNRSSRIGKSGRKLVEVGKAKDVHVMLRRAACCPALRLLDFLNHARQVLKTPVPRIAVRHFTCLAAPILQNLDQVREMT